MHALSAPPSGRGLDWCWRLLGAACVALALQEALSGHLAVHAGTLWGRRPHFLPLLPPSGAAALWLLQAAAGAALASGMRRALAVRVAAAALLLGLTQDYFNQKLFLFLLLAAFSLRAPLSAAAAEPAVPAARAQLLLLYVASAAFKLRAAFWSGLSLTAALEQVRDRGLAPLLPVSWTLDALAWPGAAAALATAALAAEFLLPFLLLARPRAGVATAVVLHFAFAACLPGLWPFSLACVAAASLFLPAPGRAGD